MKISVYIATSLDGFIARSNGDIDWLDDINEKSDTEDYGYEKFMQSVDVIVMGRNTFEKVLSFGDWPYRKKVIVLSHSLQKTFDELPPNVEIKSGAPNVIYRELQAAGTRHVYLDGGATIQAFLRDNLVDELIITTIPILLGDGIPLFGPMPHDIKLKHIKSQSYASGLLQSHYTIQKRHEQQSS